MSARIEPAYLPSLGKASLLQNGNAEKSRNMKSNLSTSKLAMATKAQESSGGRGKRSEGGNERGRGEENERGSDTAISRSEKAGRGVGLSTEPSLPSSAVTRSLSPTSMSSASPSSFSSTLGRIFPEPSGQQQNENQERDSFITIQTSHPFSGNSNLHEVDFDLIPIRLEAPPSVPLSLCASLSVDVPTSIR